MVKPLSSLGSNGNLSSRPVGVFDSGLGGLTLVRQIKRMLPNENVIYLGDTARVPYGTRSKDAVRKFSLQDADFLVGKKVKCIVIACNTASALAYDYLKKKIRLPILDVISTLPTQVKFDRYSKIGIIGTSATIKSKAHLKMIRKANSVAKIYPIACPLLVPLVEAGETKGQIVDLVIEKYLKSLKAEKLSVLILGCTHYPILKEKFKKYMGEVEIVDPAVATVRTLKSFLKALGSENKHQKAGETTYFVTDIVTNFERTAEMFLGEKIDGLVQKVDLEL